MKLHGTYLLAALTLGAPQVDLNTRAGVERALKVMVDNLMAYYTAEGASHQGSIKQNGQSDSSGFQWYEAGIMWGAVMEYIKTTGDAVHATEVVNAMTLGAYETVGSFLGTDEALAITVEGKWNDDILWWGLGPATGAEIYGRDTLMPGGVTYFQLADKTYDQVQAQYDPQCQGGLWWSRNRADPVRQRKDYKSSITQGQQIMLGARLAILSGEQKYIADSVATYNWMKETGLLTNEWLVYDGLDVGQNCGINTQILSYKSGTLMGGLAWMYRATNSEQFINDAHSMFQAANERFTSGGILYDACEAGDQCAKNQVSPKGTMVRGWGYLVEFTNSPEIKTQLQQTLSRSVQGMINTCDDNLNCGNLWSEGQNRGSDVHTQMNSVELMTAYLKTFIDGPVGSSQQAPTQAPSSSFAEDPEGSAFSSMKESIALAALALSLSLLI